MHRRDVLAGAARSISAVVAFVGVLLGIVFVLWPSLTPEGPPATKSAALEKLTLDPKVTFGQYLDRIEQSRAPYDHDQLARRGALVEFKFIITGIVINDFRFAGNSSTPKAAINLISRATSSSFPPRQPTRARGTYGFRIPNVVRAASSLSFSSMIALRASQCQLGAYGHEYSQACKAARVTATLDKIEVDDLLRAGTERRELIDDGLAVDAPRSGAPFASSRTRRSRGCELRAPSENAND